MDQNITGKMLDEYKNNLIATKRYIPIYEEANGEILYLKDYSKVVRGIGDTEIRGMPERFEDENLTLIEDPTEEEKVILATNLPAVDHAPYLEAIINGRSILKTMSRDEAAIACNRQRGKIIEEILCGKTKVADRKELELVKLTRAYLDGRLYGKSVAVLTMFAKASLTAENSKAEPLTETSVATSKEEAIIPSVLVPTGEEQTTSVSANEMPKEQSVEVPRVMPVAMDYKKMVEEVLEGTSNEDSISMTEATELLKQPEVLTIPQISTPELQPQIGAIPEIAQNVISTPASLEQMAIEAPSFEGPIVGEKSI